ncbi:MAG: pyridoxal-phosphate dependent enzyme [Planctomycetota bacterium]|nr:pyridoxal-phosphate dependent enzyme [Planctomycetota bacterium]
MTRYAATLDDIQAAAGRIKGIVHRTPVITCETLNHLSGHNLFIKCENLQKVGAFKYRGATNAIRSLPDDLAASGVCTHSCGNQALALARAARARDFPAWMVMPTTAPMVKRRAVEGYGATIVPCEPTLIARETTAASVVADTGSTFIHPYDDPRIIAGQATAAMELLEEVEKLDAVIAPVGGGGLMSGTCLTMRAMSPSTRLIGAEPKGADDAARSLEAGVLIPQEGPDTICDGLLTSLGELTWPILRDHLETIVTVDDDEVIAAMRLLWERAKTVVEPSGATPLAAVMSNDFPLPPGSRVGLILTGGNIDLERLPW